MLCEALMRGVSVRWTPNHVFLKWQESEGEDAAETRVTLSEDLGKGNVAARQSRIKLQEVQSPPPYPPPPRSVSSTRNEIPKIGALEAVQATLPRVFPILGKRIKSYTTGHTT